MKFLIALILLPLCLAGDANQGLLSVIARKNAGGGEPTLQLTVGAKGVTEDTFGSASDNLWESSLFTTTNSFDITQVVVSWKDANTPTGTVTCYVYDDGTGEAGSLVATATGTLALPLTGSFAEYEFDFSNDALLATTNYYLVFVRSTLDGGWIIWEMDSSGGDFDKSPDGSAWTFRSSKEMYARIYGVST